MKKILLCLLCVLALSGCVFEAFRSAYGDEWMAKEINAEYKIIYKNVDSGDNAGNPSAFHYADNVTISDITRMGYTFDGWYDAADGGNKVTGWEEYTKTADVTLWARWNTITYHIQYNYLDGSSDTKTYTVEDNVTLLETEDNGYRLSWVDENDKYVPSWKSGDRIGDITLTQKWMLIEYSITYENLNGADNNVNPTVYTVEDTVALSDISKVGYTFEGWYDVIKSNVSDTSTDGWNVGDRTGDVTLRAEWTPNKYNIIYKDENGASFSGSGTRPTTHTYGVQTELPDVYKDKYTFLGWYDNPECAGDPIKVLGAENVTNDITLYAQWVYGYLTTVANLANLVTTCGSQCPVIITDKNPKLSAIKTILLDNSNIRFTIDFRLCSEMKTIGAETFQDCTNLAGVALSKPLATIGNKAFSGCTGLSEITIPDSVKTIGEYAFYSCTGMTSVTMGSGVTSIGGYAFSECTGLNKVIYTGTVAQWCKIEFKDYSSANPLQYAHDLYIDGNLVTDLVIPDGVTELKFAAFYSCRSLKSVTVPNSVEKIGYAAFGCCSGLTSMTLPFVGDKRHTPDDTYQYPFGYIFGKVEYDGGSLSGQYYYGSSTDTMTQIWYYIPTSLNKVTITGSSHIPGGAFYGCHYLTSVIIPDSVTSIGSDAFDSCINLKNALIGSGIKSFGSYAFNNCDELSALYIKATTPPSFGVSMFNNCDQLPTIYVPRAKVSTYKTADGWKKYADKIVGTDF